LKSVPLVDQSAFTLPVDPVDNLFRLTSIDQLALYEERFRVDKDATRMIKQHLQTRLGPLKTDRIAGRNGCMLILYTYMRLEILPKFLDPLIDPPEPFCPAYTRRFRQQSWNFPASAFPHVSCGDTVKKLGIHPVTPEEMQEAHIPYEQTLYFTSSSHMRAI